MSETTGTKTTPETLFQALLKAQPKIAAAIKDSKNPHFKTTYADINSVIDACKEHLNAVGIVILQPVDFDDAKTWVTTILHHVASGEEIKSRAALVGASDMQKMGSAITYARRYTLQSLVLMGAEDDDGNQATQASKGQQKAQQRPEAAASEPSDIYQGQDAQKTILKDIAKAQGILPEELPAVAAFCKGKPMGTLPNVIKAWRDTKYAAK